MSTTLVGVFDNPQQANKACRALGAAGIDRSAIRMSSDELAADTDAATYFEAAQRGHVVMTVHLVDGDRANEISDLLEDCGAIDVDADGRDDVRRGELTLHDLATARQRRGPFDIGYGGVERRSRAETFSGADRRAHA